MVISWFLNVIDKNLHEFVAYVETAKDLRYGMKDSYSKSNEMCIHQLKRDITLVNQGNQHVIDCFTTLKTLWDELNAYLTIMNCNCSKEFNFNKYFEEEHVHQFLMGLDTKRFGIVKSNLLAIEPILTLNKVFVVILMEERQQILEKGMESRFIVEPSVRDWRQIDLGRLIDPNVPIVKEWDINIVNALKSLATTQFARLSDKLDKYRRNS